MHIIICKFDFCNQRMELFISDAQPEDTFSLALDFYSNYVRASQREII